MTINPITEEQKAKIAALHQQHIAALNQTPAGQILNKDNKGKVELRAQLLQSPEKRVQYQKSAQQKLAAIG